MDINQILLSPVQTEKAVRAANDQQHTFYIADGANKIEIKEAIRRFYGVRPKAVRIVQIPSKRTGQGRRKRRAFSKAIVILKKGDTLDPIKLK